MTNDNMTLGVVIEEEGEYRNNGSGLLEGSWNLAEGQVH